MTTYTAHIPYTNRTRMRLDDLEKEARVLGLDTALREVSRHAFDVSQQHGEDLLPSLHYIITHLMYPKSSISRFQYDGPSVDSLKTLYNFIAGAPFERQ